MEEELSDHEVKVADALGAAQSYLHSMRLMVESTFKGEGKDYCAFDLLIDSISIEIENAQTAVDEMTLAAQPATADYVNGLTANAYAEVELLSEIKALTARFQRRREELEGMAE